MGSRQAGETGDEVEQEGAGVKGGTEGPGRRRGRGCLQQGRAG